MSRRDVETSTSKDDARRAHPGRGRFLRGSTWAIGDYTPSKQVNNAEVATVLGSIPASSDTVESEGLQMKQCNIKY
jgi:hypothetical protein